MISWTGFTRLIWLFLLNNFLVEFSFHMDFSIKNVFWSYWYSFKCDERMAWREKKATKRHMRRSNIRPTIFVTCSYLQCRKCTRCGVYTNLNIQHKVGSGSLYFSSRNFALSLALNNILIRVLSFAINAGHHIPTMSTINFSAIQRITFLFKKKNYFSMKNDFDCNR